MNTLQYMQTLRNASQILKMTLHQKNIFDRLDKDLHTDPSVNYKILESEIISSINCHMAKRL